jgi:peptidoglycan lytic transglycosylase G
MGLFDRKPPPRERTSEDRERARAEREARRAEREGRAPETAVPPPLETPPPEAAPPAPSPPPQRPEPAQRAPSAPAPTEKEPGPTPAPGSPAPVAEAPARERPDTPSPDGAGPGGAGSDGAGPDREVVPPPRSAHVRVNPRDVDAPSAVLDEEVLEDWSALDAPPRRPLADRLRARRMGPPPPGRGDGRAAGGRRRWFPLAVLAVAAVTLLLAVWFLFSLFQPFHSEGSGRVTVTIPRGASVGQAGDLLAEKGIVSSAFFFKLRAKLEGANDVKSGTYILPRDTSYGDAFAALEKGPPKRRATDITITEGRTIREANRLLKKTSLQGSYAGAAAASRVLRPQQYGAPRSVRTKEGFLFPATYKVRVGAPVSALVDQQLRNFRRQFAKVDLRYARSKNLTPYEVLIIASMIEREAAVAKDRRLIASVIYNRLRQSIPLGIDATIRYRLDNWSRPLRQSELDADGPYNTRKRQGLPPTPIGNPGIASIQAAANPARTQFLYFVVKPCGDGEHAFQKTDAEFQRAAARYERARQAKGGSPVNC